MVTMIENTYEIIDNRKYASYVCGHCGKEFKARTDYKDRMSCGCYQKIAVRKANTTHDATDTLAYSSWSGMIGRCLKEYNASYAKYGALGITVCEEWKDFSNFRKDMGERPSKEYTLDRIDNSKGYFPSNCRWADKCTQATNKVIKPGPSGYQGVRVVGKNYHGSLYVNKIRVKIGKYTTIKECVEARNKYIVDNNLPHIIQEYIDVPEIN